MHEATDCDDEDALQTAYGIAVEVARVVIVWLVLANLVLSGLHAMSLLGVAISAGW